MAAEGHQRHVTQTNIEARHLCAISHVDARGPCCVRDAGVIFHGGNFGLTQSRRNAEANHVVVRKQIGQEKPSVVFGSSFANRGHPWEQFHSHAGYRVAGFIQNAPLDLPQRIHLHDHRIRARLHLHRTATREARLLDMQRVTARGQVGKAENTALIRLSGGGVLAVKLTCAPSKGKWVVALRTVPEITPLFCASNTAGTKIPSRRAERLLPRPPAPCPWPPIFISLH